MKVRWKKRSSSKKRSSGPSYVFFRMVTKAERTNTCSASVYQGVCVLSGPCTGRDASVSPEPEDRFRPGAMAWRWRPREENMNVPSSWRHSSISASLSWKSLWIKASAKWINVNVNCENQETFKTGPCCHLVSCSSLLSDILNCTFWFTI